MKKSPAFQFYPKDYLADENVCQMTYTEKGIYMELICHCWLEGSIPSDLEQLSRMLRLPLSELEECWPALSKCFKKGRKKDRLVQPRLQREKFAQVKRQKNYKKAGKKGAETRWSGGDLHGKAIETPMAIDSSSSLSAIKMKQAKKKKTEKLSPESKFILENEFFQVDTHLQSRPEYHVKKWKAAHPHLDLAIELRKMDAWLASDSTRLKKNYRAAITSWLNRAKSNVHQFPDKRKEIPWVTDQEMEEHKEREANKGREQTATEKEAMAEAEKKLGVLP